MDFYSGSLVLGGAGLLTMALGGVFRHAGTHHHHAVGHRGDAALRGHHGGHGRGLGAQSALYDAALSLVSPRVLFSLALGLGTAGSLLRSRLGEPWLFACSFALGVAFERFLITAIWNFLMRFATKPALTLESAICERATAVTAFDQSGRGIVQLDFDGHVVQVLGTLTARERSCGIRVRAGDHLRIEDVDAARNRCTVSVS